MECVAIALHGASWVRPLVSYTPYNKDEVLKAQHDTAQAIQIFEDNLRDRKDLIRYRLTLADIMCASLLTFGFAKIFDREWRKGFPYFTEWYLVVMHLPIMKAVVPETFKAP
ncbi:glutathione S-transferase [Aspergillus cavernicola]|uniref:Glutathione S-transferase n=1 Tax=Aspergillus cavernicola TaxID=176166 RepID=A0ABR4ICF0_9EURO